MKGLKGVRSLGFTICLLFGFLTTSPPARGQSVEDKPASEAPQAVQAPATSTNATPGNAPENAAESSASTADPNYVLGPEDEIEVEVFDVPELKQTVRVATDGLIALPLIGRVPASGLTAEQLRQELADKWGENYLQNPQVSVFVKEFKSRPVSILGAVEKPGLYRLHGPRTLIEMLSDAGGFGKKGSSPAGRTVLITRKSGFGDLQPTEGMHVRGPDQVEIDLNRLIYTRDEKLNIEIKPLDVISVTHADIVYVIGAVKLAGSFVLEDRPTVTALEALTMAGGFTPTAARGAARILRTQKDGSKIEVPIDLRKVLKGKVEDTTLAANDTLYIPDSKTKMATARAIDVSVSTFSGWLIWAH
jgi:polysaccharide export outer membrane protein